MSNHQHFNSQLQSIGVEGAKTPAGTARAEALGLSVAREKAEAVPAESVAHETEIDDSLRKFYKNKQTADLWVGSAV